MEQAPGLRGAPRPRNASSEGLEWLLAPTMKQIQWGRVEFDRNGKKFAITHPMVDVPNPSPEPRVEPRATPANLVLRYTGSIERQLNRTIVRLEQFQAVRRK